MKVYTGTGDQGKTSLFSGERIAKDDFRIDAYGDIDELNACVGGLAAALEGVDGAEAARERLEAIQSDLFQVGAWLATTPGSAAADHLTPFRDDRRTWLEAQIDEMDAGLEPLNVFILPGGHASAAWAHLARTVCRRAERRVIGLSRQQGLGFPGAQEMMVYLNRLSDYFFVLARHCNRLAGVQDTPRRG
jgi:cob(I)alamin adenosyltransferase